MKIKPFRNPLVKKHWTAEQRQQFANQINKYFQRMQGNEDSFVMGHDTCLICEATKDREGDVRCLICPLGDGIGDSAPCRSHPTFIGQYNRRKATPLRIARRMDYLIAQFEINGLEVYDVEESRDSHPFPTSF